MVAGFFKGLFGAKPKDEASVEPETKQPKPKREKAQAYYLDADNAQSYGNAEYMRTAKSIRRTFPKTVNNEELEFEREISSMNNSDRKLGTQIPKVSIGAVPAPTSSTPSNANSSASTSNSAGTTARRRADSSMDVFRKMAKDIRK